MECCAKIYYKTCTNYKMIQFCSLLRSCCAIGCVARVYTVWIVFCNEVVAVSKVPVVGVVYCVRAAPQVVLPGFTLYGSSSATRVLL